MLKRPGLVICFTFVVAAPLFAESKVMRYEADVQSIVLRKIGGKDRQVIENTRQVVEIGEDWRRTTTSTTGKKSIYEVTPKRVTIKTVRDGETTTQEIDVTKVDQRLKDLFGGGNKSGPPTPTQVSQGFS